MSALTNNQLPFDGIIFKFNCAGKNGAKRKALCGTPDELGIFMTPQLGDSLAVKNEDGMIELMTVSRRIPLSLGSTTSFQQALALVSITTLEWAGMDHNTKIDRRELDLKPQLILTPKEQSLAPFEKLLILVLERD